MRKTDFKTFAFTLPSFIISSPSTSGILSDGFILSESSGLTVLQNCLDLSWFSAKEIHSSCVAWCMQFCLYQFSFWDINFLTYFFSYELLLRIYSWNTYYFLVRIFSYKEQICRNFSKPLQFALIFSAANLSKRIFWNMSLQKFL